MEDRRQRQQGNERHHQQGRDLSRRNSSTSLGRRRSSNQLLNHNKEPKLWSDIVKPTVKPTTVGIQMNNDREGMQRRIQELENELAKRDGNKSNKNSQPKNLQVPPHHGGGEPSNNTSTEEMENQASSSRVQQINPMELNDMLEMISTTMATLKDFESRFRNVKSF